MSQKVSLVLSFALSAGVYLLGNPVSARTNPDDAGIIEPTKAEINECLNANTLIFTRASFFNQASPTGTILPYEAYVGGQVPGISIQAGSRSYEEGRASKSSLKAACEKDPALRLKNPAMEEAYVGKAPKLNTPRLIPKIDTMD